jgi:hypothetical protein
MPGVDIGQACYLTVYGHDGPTELLRERHFRRLIFSVAQVCAVDREPAAGSDFARKPACRGMPDTCHRPFPLGIDQAEQLLENETWRGNKYVTKSRSIKVAVNPVL